METVTDQNVHRQRAAAFTTLAQLADEHGLPMPKGVTFPDERFDSPYIDIRLDDNRRGSVTGWAEVLRLGELVPMAVPATGTAGGFTSWQADASDFDGPVWLGFAHVHLWSKCTIAPPTQAEIDAGADYGREPDNGDPDAPVPPGVDGGRVGAGPGRTTGGA